ncbi:MAG TPA: AAA family ATPase, partial [Trueperaceae bacterium]|nr:AAA family ATPase [Trueperaceae bacterium]
MAPTAHTTNLLGRHLERAALDTLLAATRGNQGQVLVLRGESGIGKTALLDYVAGQATDCTILRSIGVESEMELPYARLHQFCAPLLRHLPALPEPQRDALRTAFGLAAGATANHFLVGLGVLSLMSEVANDRPLVCLIDDAQWLDRTSAQLLSFVARRLLAEPIAMVFAVREPHPAAELDGLAQITVPGLDYAEARALFDATVPGRVDAHVRDRFLAEAHGNPLALLELQRGTLVADLAGGFALPSTSPLIGRIEQSFLHRVQRLPVDSQRLLLLAAAEPVGDVALLWRAAGTLEIGGNAAAAAESEGLIELGVRVRFCHPLVRSAVYRAADADERLEIHQALADATDPAIDPDRRAWHLAQAVMGPDEDVAGELERSAARARQRGGNAAAAAFLKRSAELTPSPGRRAVRALDAARATYEAGAPDAAYALLTAAEVGPLDDLQRARLRRLHAQIEFARRRGPEASPMLLDAASRLEPLNASLARETYLEAFAAAFSADR